MEEESRNVSMEKFLTALTLLKETSINHEAFDSSFKARRRNMTETNDMWTL